jgi:hypothetical protein
MRIDCGKAVTDDRNDRRSHQTVLVLSLDAQRLPPLREL